MPDEMNPEQRHLLDLLMSKLAGMSDEEQAESVFDLVALLLKHLSTDQIHELRGELAMFTKDEEVFSGIIDLIDGHLALRVIGGEYPTR